MAMTLTAGRKDSKLNLDLEAQWEPDIQNIHTFLIPSKLMIWEIYKNPHKIWPVLNQKTFSIEGQLLILSPPSSLSILKQALQVWKLCWYDN